MSECDKNLLQQCVPLEEKVQKKKHFFSSSEESDSETNSHNDKGFVAFPLNLKRKFVSEKLVYGNKKIGGFAKSKY